MSSVYSNFFWWGGTELNRHRNIRLIYSQLSSPLAQSPHKNPMTHPILIGSQQVPTLTGPHQQFSLFRYMVSKTGENVKSFLIFI